MNNTTRTIAIITIWLTFAWVATLIFGHVIFIPLAGVLIALGIAGASAVAGTALILVLGRQSVPGC